MYSLPVGINIRVHSGKSKTYTRKKRALRRQRLETFRIHGHSHRNRLCVHLKGRQVQIRNRITGLMVVDIRRDPRLAPEHRRLRLDLLGASESAASRDAVADEGLVVRSPIENRGGRVESVIRKPGFEEVLDFRGACQPGHVEGGAVAIVDCVNVIRRGYHVEIEVGADIGELAGGERLDIIRGVQHWNSGVHAR